MPASVYCHLGLKPGLDPGHERGKGPGPVLIVVLAGEEVGQFVAQTQELVSRRVQQDGAGPMEGFGQDEGGAVPVFIRIGKVLRVPPEMNRPLAEAPANLLSPSFQLRKAAFLHEPIVNTVAAVAPDLAVKDQIGIMGGIKANTALGAFHQLLATSRATHLPQVDPTLQEGLSFSRGLAPGRNQVTILTGSGHGIAMDSRN
jgi:hypothetical protein